MSQKTIVVALGGNAILSSDASAKAQQAALVQTAQHLVKLVEQGHRLVITHGNGPQVGNLLLQQAAAHSEKNPAMPLDTCVSMTEGSIGYWLQNAMGNLLKEKQLKRSVVSLVTQVVVSADDPAFTNLTKPIGPFLTEEEAKQAAEETGDTYKEDAGRGYRKVVASPKPVRIDEIEVIQQLVDNDVIVVAAGGGGIPVVEEDNQLRGVEAVIDKDFASQKLAVDIKADYFIVLTGVDNVYVNFNQPDQKKLETVTVAELEQYIGENQFAPGSMLPKVEAVIAFVKEFPEGKAVISSLENIEAVLAGTGGTVVTA
ncbi:carbamate kinase [Aerococcaceae bacterium NML210727]|nr:carbamate kinase [Aerococcaceae bacterium NML210727]MCW6654208.1 carbamate kinase [Aerococcaceae bacterium NML201296]MCW6662169.1 carbamate kinase [Aerococcaceae bacterium NML201209]MCW6663625.1 carbamate kinase [Aerococcaceae bacterium NML190073]MCW6665879.1 carbamate kinase [Aerococcaceae bacterium NML191219]MCW6666996.1 carbamate kinase [Aerococcaceae bacterium NML190938]MCW6679577.1 carbamate kinase [Aerococcaceae bacterium NML130460]MDO4775710.1 carbamate kinase [Aerococcaceae bacter